MEAWILQGDIKIQMQMQMQMQIYCSEDIYSYTNLLSQEGETVTGGLKRLGALAAKPRRGKQSKAPAALPPPSVLTEEERQRATEAFDELTEASSALMDSGELDVYSKDKVPPRVSIIAIYVSCCVPY